MRNTQEGSVMVMLLIVVCLGVIIGGGSLLLNETTDKAAPRNARELGVQAGLSASMMSLRTYAESLAMMNGSYAGLCRGTEINSADSSLSGIISYILKAKNAPTQLEAGVLCFTNSEDYAISVGSDYCLSSQGYGPDMVADSYSLSCVKP